jgi:hypothetical protein
MSSFREGAAARAGLAGEWLIQHSHSRVGTTSGSFGMVEDVEEKGGPKNCWEALKMKEGRHGRREAGGLAEGV